jgi:hypothetical protein
VFLSNLNIHKSRWIYSRVPYVVHGFYLTNRIIKNKTTKPVKKIDLNSIFDSLFYDFSVDTNNNVLLKLLLATAEQLSHRLNSIRAVRQLKSQAFIV